MRTMHCARLFAKRFFAAISLSALCVLASAAGLLGLHAETAYAASNDVRYIAILGADTWILADETNHNPAADMMAIARVDVTEGTVSILTIPRDLRYDNITSIIPSAKVLKANWVYKLAFDDTINDDWRIGKVESNYKEATEKAAEATCQMMSDITGLSITDYAVVDLYTYREIADKIGGITVDIPVGIKGYHLYTEPAGNTYDVNKGNVGVFTLYGWDAMIAARAREPYCKWTASAGYNIKYASLSEYKGAYPQLLIQKIIDEENGTKEYWYHFDGDGTRQFINRRALGNLIVKGLGRTEGAANFVWNQLVASNLVFTNLSESDVKAIGDGLTKAQQAGKLAIYGASIISPERGDTYELNDETQYLIPLDKWNTGQKDATLAQFKAGTPMTSGWAAETIVGSAQSPTTPEQTKSTSTAATAAPAAATGISKGQKAVYKKVTYKALNASSVSVVKVPNKKNVSIPATVTLNGKQYNVTTIAAKSMKGKKVRKVTLGANVKKISANAFKGSKATTLVLKTTKLKKASVKGSLKGSKVKTIKVSVTKSKKKATLKKYRKYFSRSNVKSSLTLKIS